MMNERDEFDDFLKSAEKHEAQRFETKAALLRVESIVNHALEHAGYIPLDKDEERISEFVYLINELREDRPDMTDEHAQNLLDVTLGQTNIAEVYAITILGLEFIKNDMLADTPTHDELNDQKRRVYAELLQKDHLDPDSPILVAFNNLIPGDTVDPHDEAMVPYYAAAIQKKEAADNGHVEYLAQLDSVVRSFGIDETHPQWNVIWAEIAEMALASLPYKRPDANKANLDAKLHGLPSDIDPELREKMIQYFLTES